MINLTDQFSDRINMICKPTVTENWTFELLSRSEFYCLIDVIVGHILL